MSSQFCGLQKLFSPKFKSEPVTGCQGSKKFVASLQLLLSFTGTSPSGNQVFDVAADHDALNAEGKLSNRRRSSLSYLFCGCSSNQGKDESKKPKRLDSPIPINLESLDLTISNKTKKLSNERGRISDESITETLSRLADKKGVELINGLMRLIKNIVDSPEVNKIIPEIMEKFGSEFEPNSSGCNELISFTLSLGKFYFVDGVMQTLEVFGYVPKSFKWNYLMMDRMFDGFERLAVDQDFRVLKRDPRILGGIIHRIHSPTGQCKRLFSKWKEVSQRFQPCDIMIIDQVIRRKLQK